MPATTGVSVRVQVRGSTTVLAAGGELDLTTSDVLASAAVEALGRAMVVDLDGVTLLCTSGITVLVQTHTVAVQCGIRFRVTNPRRVVERVLRITDLYERLTVV